MEVVRTKSNVGNDILDFYSPPRITHMAKLMGLQPGYASDFTVKGPDGLRWDFTRARDRLEAWKLTLRDRPYLIIGSPPRTAFSILQNLNKKHLEEYGKLQEKLREGLVHLEFCARLYNHQLHQGLYFLHEHPQTASSWKVPCIERARNSPLVQIVVAHQCAFGLTFKDELGEGPVNKPTLSSFKSVAMLRQLDRQCLGCERHVQLLGGKAAAAAIYPKGRCKAVCVGVKHQMELGAQDQFMTRVDGDVDTVEIVELWSDPAIPPDDGRGYWDDISGKVLDAKLVKEARAEEINEAELMGVWEKVPRSRCIAETGRPRVGTRWVDVNQGDGSQPKVRSRLVAQELKKDNDFELFVATPPTEYVKYLVSRVASTQKSASPTCLMVQDVKGAFFYAPSTRPIFGALPPGALGEGDVDSCGMLKKELVWHQGCRS